MIKVYQVRLWYAIAARSSVAVIAYRVKTRGVAVELCQPNDE
jgi:hypothetical protein